MNSRHLARQVAVQALYWLHSQPWDELADMIDDLGQETSLGPKGQSYALMLCRAAQEGHAAYEHALASVSEHWDPDRIGRVERIIIRLALAEWDMRQSDVPPKVVLNESVTLAGEFCGEEAARFVNGILDRLGRDRGLLARDAAPDEARSA